MSALSRFPRNFYGRDFVVGDIHGQFPLLATELAALGFDGARDRLFSVGDLIDRGDRSVETLDWLALPWFHAVRGNHEAMLLDAQYDPVVLSTWMINGGEWWYQTSEPIRDRFVSVLAELPWAIEVETSNGRVAIVHADVPSGQEWDAFTAALEAGEPEARTCALWSRRRLWSGDASPVPGVDAVFCGHTVVAAPLQLGNVHFIDTGAYATDQFAIVPLDLG